MQTGEMIRAHTLDQRRRGLQESTIAVRRRLIRQLADRLGEKGLCQATAEDIERFLDTRLVSPGARAGYLSHLKVFYDWAVANGHIDRDPTITIPRPKHPKGLPRPITDADLDLALRMSGGQIRALLCLAAFQGMRCIGIARLVWDDVFADRDPAMILAREKGAKNRLIPLHPATCQALDFLPLPHKGPVIREPDGRAMPAWKVSHVGNDFLHGMGIESTMHQLRHWFGTGVYRASGGDLLLTRDLMGHENVETTRIYAAFNPAGAPDAVKALTPKPAGRDPTGAASAPRGAGGPGALSPEAPDPTKWSGVTER